MMSVKEYAIDVNLSVEKILELCKKLDMNVSLEDDMLDDEMIIILDNEIANIDIEDEVIEETIDELNSKGEKLGLIKVHLYRPFSKKHLK